MGGSSSTEAENERLAREVRRLQAEKRIQEEERANERLRNEERFRQAEQQRRMQEREANELRERNNELLRLKRLEEQRTQEEKEDAGNERFAENVRRLKEADRINHQVYRQKQLEKVRNEEILKQLEQQRREADLLRDKNNELLRLKRLEEQRIQEEKEAARIAARIKLYETCRVVKSDIVHDMVVPTMHTEHWDHSKNLDVTVIYIQLNPTEDEFKQVLKMFKYANKRHFVVTMIERVQNPYLMMSYLLKKQEKRNKFKGRIVHEKKYFHGTKHENIDAICKRNYDYRLSGRNIPEQEGKTYGHGVSFFPSAFYATHHSSRYNNERKMILTYVLQVDVNVSSCETRLPNECCDTTMSEDEKVVVKYEDNEFYPAYIITYHQDSFVPNFR